MDDELRRVIPVIEQLAPRTAALISIDTTKAAVAREALQAGAHVVNDISGLSFDLEMPEVCADTQAGVICMHIQGTPQTMQIDPQYGDVVTEICTFFEARLQALEAAGIARECVMLDPGIGFGKTAEHNLDILSHVARFRALGRPVAIGHSRKRFLKRILGRPVDERTFGTVGISVALAMQSTDLIRVHDVAATRDALLAWQAVASRIDRVETL
jgi:dihydropteroate synthase